MLIFAFHPMIIIIVVIIKAATVVAALLSESGLPLWEPKMPAARAKIINSSSKSAFSCVDLNYGIKSAGRRY
jgi:hypothetical protein